MFHIKSQEISIIKKVHHLTVLLSLEITLLTHSLSKMDTIEMLTLSNSVPSPLFLNYLFLKVNAQLLDVLTIFYPTAEILI
jgi:hypothetical protein